MTLSVFAFETGVVLNNFRFKDFALDPIEVLLSLSLTLAQVLFFSLLTCKSPRSHFLLQDYSKKSKWIRGLFDLNDF
jgi:hypothetical protein